MVPNTRRMNDHGLKRGVHSERHRRQELKRKALIVKVKQVTLLRQYRERSFDTLGQFIAEVRELQASGDVDAESAREAIQRQLDKLAKNFDYFALKYTCIDGPRRLDFAEWILARSSGP